MRRLNVKLAVILASSILAFAVGVFFLHKFQVDRSADSLPARAEQFKRDGRYEDAYTALFRYTLYRPDGEEGEEGAERLGNFLVDWIEKKDKSREETVSAFTKAKDRLDDIVLKYPDKVELRRKLAELLSLFNDPNAQVFHFKQIIEQDPNDLDSSIRLALALYRTNDQNNRKAAKVRLGTLVGFDEATGKFDPAKAKAKDRIEAYMALAQMIRAESNESRSADGVFNALVAANPQNHKAYLVRAQNHLQLNRTEDARKDIARALELDKKQDDVAVLLSAATVARQTNELSKAQQLLEVAVRKFPKEEGVYVALKDLAVANGRMDKAVLYVAQGLEATGGKSVELLFHKGWLQAVGGDLSDAKDTVKIVERQLKGGRNEALDRLEAFIILREGKYAEAIRRIERLRIEMAKGGPASTAMADTWLGQCYEALEMYDRQVEAYKRVILAKTDDVSAWVALARGYTLLGRTAEAFQIYLKLKTDEKLLGEERFCKAPEVWQSYFELALRRELRKPERDRDWSAIENLLKALEKYKAASPAVIARLRLDIMNREGKFDAMRVELDQMLAVERAKDDPRTSDPQVWIMHVRLLAQEKGKGPAEALKALDEVERRFGDSVAMRLQRATFTVMRGGTSVTADLAALERGAEKLDRKSLWRGLALSYVQINNTDEAKRLYKQVIAEDANDLSTRSKLFELSMATGDEEGMDQALVEIEKLLGKDNDVWNFYMAARMLSKAGGDEGEEYLRKASAHLKKVVEMRPTWFRAAQLEADIAARQNDRDGAIKALVRSLDLGPPAPQTVDQLSRLYVDRGLLDEARKTIERLGDDRMPTQLRKLDAQLELAASVQDAARLAKAEAVATDLMTDLEKDSTATATDYVWYASMLLQFKKPDDAEKALRKAIAKNPEDAGTWRALVEHLARQGKKKEANDAVRDLELALSDEQLIDVLPDCYVMVDRVLWAERLLQERLDTAPNDLERLRRMAGFYLATRSPKAETYIDRMLTIGGRRLDPNLIWARREKARLLNATGEFPDHAEAMKLIQANYIDGKPSLADLAIEVDLLRSRGEFIYWERAIAKILEIKKERPILPTNLQRMLAELYAKTNDWAKCREELYKLARSEERDPSVQAMVADLFLSHKETNQADTFVSKLEKLAPRSPETLRRRAAVLAATGKKADAIKLLQTLVPPAPRGAAKESPEDLNKILYVANEFGRLKELDLAEGLYRRFVKARPDDELVFAQFLALRGEPKSIDEAIEIGDRAFAKAKEGGSILPVLDTGSRLLRYAEQKPTAKQIAAIERWYKWANDENPGSMSILQRTAEYRDLQGRPKEAVAAYREILAKADLEPSQRGFVLNNLSFLDAVSGGDLDEALKQCQEAISLLGERTEVLDTRGMIYYKRGEFAKAVEDFRFSIRGGESAAKHFHLAIAELGAGNRAGALEAWRSMERLELDVNDLSPPEKTLYEKAKAELRPTTGAKS